MVDFVDSSVKVSLGKFFPDARQAITVWNVFLPKPDVPPAIAANYRQVRRRVKCFRVDTQITERVICKESRKND
jgi:hypothetical protein